jgi:hypothetical protein
MKSFLLGSIYVSVAASLAIGQTTVLHVDPAITTPGNGLSWANAKKTLQDALDIVNNNSGDYEIRLAGDATSPMLYKPDEAVDFSLTPGDRNLYFLVRTGLTIRGGYDSSTGSQDPEYFISVLSGDIGTPSDEADNSIQVVRALDSSSGDIELSSLVIEDSFPTMFVGNFGVDLSAINATVTLSDVRIRRHGAGGLSIYASSINLVRTIIEDNKLQGGGALGGYEGGSVFLQDCIVRNNEGDGAAVAGLDIATTGTVQVIHCLVADNVGQMAGGVRIVQPESLLLLRSVIHGNIATGIPGDPHTPSWFGGMWLEGNTNDSVANMWYCYVSDNHSAGDTGGMHCRFFLQFFANNCAFKDNTAFTRGGAIWSLKNGLHLVNCTLTDNFVGEPDDGGGVYYTALSASSPSRGAQSATPSSGATTTALAQTPSTTRGNAPRMSTPTAC